MDTGSKHEEVSWGIMVGKHEVSLGREFGPLFIMMLAETTVLTLQEWMKKNNAPKEAIDMVWHCCVLERCAIGLQQGNLSDLDAQLLIQELGAITQEIPLLGGSFYSQASQYPPNGEVLTWKPAETQPED